MAGLPRAISHPPHLLGWRDLVLLGCGYLC